MADNNSLGEKIPLDAKESFLRSVRKKNGDVKPSPAEEKPAESKETSSQEKDSPAEDIPVLFDNYNEKDENELAKEKKEADSSSEKKETVKEKEEIVSDKKQDKETEKKDKSDKKDKSQNKKKNGKKDKSDKKDKTENKKKSDKKDKEQKVQEKEALKTYIKLPFVKLIPFFMALQSVFLIVIPFLSEDSVVTFVFVTLFWISVLASGGLMLFIKIKYYNDIYSSDKSMSNAGRVYRFVSLVNFFRNEDAKKADIVFFIVSAITIVFVALGTKNIFDHIAVIAAVLSLFLLSLNMHVFFNDSIYEYSLKFKKNKSKKEVIDNE